MVTFYPEKKTVIVFVFVLDMISMVTVYPKKIEMVIVFFPAMNYFFYLLFRKFKT